MYDLKRKLIHTSMKRDQAQANLERIFKEDSRMTNLEAFCAFMAENNREIERLWAIAIDKCREYMEAFNNTRLCPVCGADTEVWRGVFNEEHYCQPKAGSE